MTVKEQKSPQSLAISGGDEWNVEELSEFLGHIYVLYNRVSVLKEKRQRTPANLSRQMYASKARVAQKHKMTVESLTIQSPMKINLQGIGEIIREVREAIKDIHRNPLERRKLEQQLQHDSEMNEVELANSKVELIRTTNQTMIEIGISDEDRKATLKALLDPAKAAADIVTAKSLVLEEEMDKLEE